MFTEGELDRLGFGDIAQAGGCGVGVEIIDLLWIDLAVVEGHFDSVGRAAAIG